MNRIIIIVLLLIISVDAIFSQQLSNSEKVSIVNYAKRVYQKEKTDGCRIITCGKTHVLLTTITIKESSAMQRVAEVKALRAAGEFLQGASTESISTIVIDDKNDSICETKRDIIKVSSFTRIKKMELLGSTRNQNFVTFFFYRELQETNGTTK